MTIRLAGPRGPTPTPLTLGLHSDPETEYKRALLGERTLTGSGLLGSGPSLNNSLIRSDWGPEENTGRPGFRPPC